MSIGKKLRFEIFKRDDFTCQYCGKQTPNCILEVDHILPVSEGGTDDPNNLISSCFDCNRGKGKVKISKQLIKNYRKEEIEENREINEQIKEYEKYLRNKKATETRRVNQIKKHWENKCYNEFSLNEYGEQTIRKFIKYLTVSEIKDAIDIASQKLPISKIEERFKYFCGICHNRIAEKKGDESRILYRKIKSVWLSKPRGSGYFKDYQLKEICSIYSEKEILAAIEETFSERRGSYWQSFLTILGYNHA